MERAARRAWAAVCGCGRGHAGQPNDEWACSGSPKFWADREAANGLPRRTCQNARHPRNGKSDCVKERKEQAAMREGMESSVSYPSRPRANR